MPHSELDAVIIAVVIPKCYQIINDLLAEAQHSKELTKRARDILPAKYPQSWQGIRKK